jgi:UDP-glucose 4-epimerase
VSQVANVVLVTGVSRFLGGHLAARLAANADIERVLGVDTAPPHRDLLRRMGRTEFVRADIRNPLIAKVVSGAGVDTVVHTALLSHPRPGGRAAMKEMNVLGTMRLLAACQKSPAVRKVIVRSTSAVYGVSSQDPAVFTEDMEPSDLPSSGYAKDATEIEDYVRGFGRRRPDVDITTLRFSNLIGPRIDALLARYFAMPVVPVVFGYDARLQLLHSEDALEILDRATTRHLPGVFNAGGHGVLMLSQAIRRAGRLAMPVPGVAVGPVSGFLRSTRLVDFSPEQLRFLNFGRVIDTARLVQRFGFTPRWTTRQAFDDFVRGRGLTPIIPAECVRDVEHSVASVLAKLR